MKITNDELKAIVIYNIKLLRGVKGIPQKVMCDAIGLSQSE